MGLSSNKFEMMREIRMGMNTSRHQALVKFKDNIIEELKSFFNECNIVLDSTECYRKLLETTDESELFIPYQGKVIMLLFTFTRDWTLGMFYYKYRYEQNNDTVTHFTQVPTLELLKKRTWYSTTLDGCIRLEDRINYNKVEKVVGKAIYKLIPHTRRMINAYESFAITRLVRELFSLAINDVNGFGLVTVDTPTLEGVVYTKDFYRYTYNYYLYRHEYINFVVEYTRERGWVVTVKHGRYDDDDNVIELPLIEESVNYYSKLANATQSNKE